jgi:hypothetical protein
MSRSGRRAHSKQKPKGGGIGICLDLEPFHRLFGELASWKIDPTVQAMEQKLEQGRILGFVRGLRLSAQLIYIIRESLLSAGLSVDWGHIIDDDEIHCSPECDVIIHRGFRRQWDGNIKPVMDFKFVDCRNAVAVISCKSFMDRIDRGYAREMKPYLSNVFLFAECCEPRRVKTLKNSARTAGYKGFWYLYTWDRKTLERTKNEEEWCDFLTTLEKMKS